VVCTIFLGPVVNTFQVSVRELLFAIILTRKISTLYTPIRRDECQRLGARSTYEDDGQSSGYEEDATLLAKSTKWKWGGLIKGRQLVFSALSRGRRYWFVH